MKKLLILGILFLSMFLLSLEAPKVVCEAINNKGGKVKYMVEDGKTYIGYFTSDGKIIGDLSPTTMTIETFKVWCIPLGYNSTC